MFAFSDQTFFMPFDAAWLNDAAAGLDPQGRLQLQRAVAWAAPRFQNHTALTGELLEDHAAAVARILAALRSDAATRVAAILAPLPTHSSVQPLASHDVLAKEFGVDVARLVQGARALLRLGGIARRASDSVAATSVQKEMQRKMLLAMAADLRIVLMRLASRLQSLRWYAATKQPCPAKFARETLDLYTPLVNRLGIWQIKWEMEDLAFRFLDPERYKEIAGWLEEKRVEREAFITTTIARLQAALMQAGIHAEVSGRPKHIYSIWVKMHLKTVDFSQMYDLRALRIIVDDVRSCYAALAQVHALWTPLTEEFDDYIARPKPNGYRSLHTVVHDQNARPFEVQIRTCEMHQFAEYGMAAHWHYKEAGVAGGNVAASSEYDRQLSWMRQLLAWNADLSAESGSVAVTNPVRPPGSAEHIYVLTPQARVIELPVGSTPVDFAYHLHTDLGHRCRGARADGQLVPLHTQLATGQTVEVVAAKVGGPSRDWLNPQLGFLASTRARTKVRGWFNAIELRERITHGQAMVEKELQRLGKTTVNLEQLAQQLGFACADDLYVTVAKEEYPLRQINGVFQQPLSSSDEPVVLTYASRAESTAKGKQSGVLVAGVAALMTQLARCCRPVPPDAIVGFVTRGRGVSIHRATCRHYAAMARRESERMIQVAWGQTSNTLYPVNIVIHAHDRPGLLRDLSEVFARLRLNVTGANTQSRNALAHLVFTVEVHDSEALGRALTPLSAVVGVTRVGRQ